MHAKVYIIHKQTIKKLIPLLEMQNIYIYVGPHNHTHTQTG